jgi:hypothetical protein
MKNETKTKKRMKLHSTLNNNHDTANASSLENEKLPANILSTHTHYS